MVSILAYPKPLVKDDSSIVLTFVVPTSVGCGLNCRHCFIDQRKELENNTKKLTAEQYVDFIYGIREQNHISCISIQGKEPFAEDSVPYTLKILKAAQGLNIPSAIVTNGLYLSKHIKDLSNFDLKEIFVSLDSPRSRFHDQVRGKTGAFQNTMQGLQLALASPRLSKIVSIASLYLPNKIDFLIDFPRFLHELGISRWFVTPALTLRSDTDIGRPMHKPQSLVNDLLTLNEISNEFDIDMVIEDEYYALREIRNMYESFNNLKFRILTRPGGIMRLLPSGHCDIGLNLIKIHSKTAPRWDPQKEHPAIFYNRIVTHYDEI